MNEEREELYVPDFQPQIPDHLLKGLTPREQWVHEQMSIHGQQNMWLIRREQKAARRHREIAAAVAALDQRTAALENLKNTLGAKWSLVAGLVAVVLVPLIVSLAGSWVAHVLGWRKP